MRNELNEKESFLYHKIVELKKESGSHSPSILTIKEKIPELEIKVDACFLSNPYATELFLKYLDLELIQTRKIRDVLEFYPSQNDVLSSVLSSHLGIDHRTIFVGNGAIEIIQAVLTHFVSKKIVINIPTFSSYYEFVPNHVQIVYNKLLPENDFLLINEEYIKLIKTEKPDTIVIINPNNPDGNYIPYNQILSLIEELKDIQTIILDESFIHFAYEDDQHKLLTFVNLVDRFPNLIVIKSMSKDFGIAGIRAGYGIMNRNRVTSLQKKGYLWNLNGLAEYFFRLYVRSDFMKEYEHERQRYIIESKSFFENLKTISSIQVYPSRANFALIKLRDDWDSDSFVTQCLVRYGLYLRTGSDKIGLDGPFVRVASRTKYENQIIIDALSNLTI